MGGRIVLVLLAGLCAMAGCRMTKQGADLSARSAIVAEARAIPEEAWPARRTAGLPSIDNAAVIEVMLNPEKPGDAPQQFKTVLRRRCEPVGRGWIVEGIGNRDPDLKASEIQRRLSYCTWSKSEPTAATALPWGTQDDLALNYQIEDAIKTADIQVTFEISPSRAGPAKGIILFCPGLTGWEYQVPVAELLRDRGWMVLSFVRFTNASEEEAARQGSFDLRARARTLSREEMNDEAVMRRCVEAAVVTAGDFVADFAYAYEAAFRYVEEQSPELRSKPAVIVACSLGAILAPTLSARLGDRVDAAVLIGGGVDVCGILTTSGVLSDPLILHTEDRPVPLTSVLAERIRDEYLAGALLDPYSTAPLLASRPVLVIQGRDDDVVKPRYGDLLWERLGRPERWVGNYGHSLLFYFLEEHAGEIADWIDEAIAAK